MSRNFEEMNLAWLTSCTSCGEDRIADFYEVFYRASGMREQSILVVGRNSQSTTISDLSANTMYTVAVRITSAIIRTSTGTAYIRSDRSTEESITTGMVQSPAKFTSTQKMYFFHLCF